MTFLPKKKKEKKKVLFICSQTKLGFEVFRESSLGP